MYSEVVYDRRLNMYATDNRTGLCGLNKVITVCYDDRRHTNIFCGGEKKLQSFCMLNCATLFQMVTVFYFLPTML